MANELPRTEITSPQTVTFEAVMPADMAMRAEESGIKRAALNPLAVFVLSLLGGAFHPDGNVHQVRRTGHLLESYRQGSGGLSRPDLDEFSRQPYSGNGRKYYWRGAECRRGLLVRLSQEQTAVGQDRRHLCGEPIMALSADRTS